MKDTIFGKIIRREIPAEIVYEDDATLAFLDIMPNAPGHTLVVPKEPSENMLDIADESFLAVMKTVKKVALAAKPALEADGFNILVNNGAEAGQQVFHTHVHIIPRYKSAAFQKFPPGKPNVKVTPEELKEIADKIRAALA
jgi:histidine triad (HIT) family protein